MHKISDSTILNTLNELHKQSKREFPKILKGLSKGIFRKLKPEDMKDTFIAISRKQGEFLYDLLIKTKAKNIIEFGTSFGISTIYLAAAAKENDGFVITTELLPEKCRVAKENFESAGLIEQIELREGDALKTLKEVSSDIDFLLLDGWNDLYLPILKLLEPKFRNGTLIYTDNVSFKSAKPFLDYIKDNGQKYVTKRNKDGSELTEFIG